jgi:hypothetical protein
MRNLIQDSRYPGRDWNRHLLNTRHHTLLLESVSIVIKVIKERKLARNAAVGTYTVAISNTRFDLDFVS